MSISRRGFVAISFAAWAGQVWGQGVASRNVKAQAKFAPSGRPFDARFTDVARDAGLLAPVVYGAADHKDYILEATGCGCAFFDYDNDGWMDIFILSGTHMEAAPEGASNRLYKNNRDGTFTDVTEKAGLHDVGWASGVCIGDYNNDGNEDLFITYYGQNKLTATTAMGRSPMSRKKRASLAIRLAGEPGARSSTTTVTGIWTCSSPTILSSM